MVNKFFIPLYEASFKNKKTISPIEKEADMIFCEREFVEWLRNKFRKKLTEKSYRKYCSLKYFKLFMPVFNRLKKKQEFINKKEVILQQLISNSKFPEITKHEYDVDIVESHFRLKKLLETQFTYEELKTKKDYLNSFFHPIQYYCTENKMSLERVIQSNYPIVIQNTAYNFQAFLGRTLIVCDINKITAILGYQNSLWKGEGMFASFVEHLVYSFVLHNDSFKKNDRLVKIMDWVEKNRIFVSFDATKEEKEKGPTHKYGETIASLSQYDYWPYSEEKLIALYDLLVKNNKVEKTNFFHENFKTFVEFPVNPIVWKTSTIQLMYLLDLIYKQEAQYKSIPLQAIAFKLFISNNKNFDTKGLNTTLLNAKPYHLKGAKLSPGIKSIKNIFDSLGLY